MLSSLTQNPSSTSNRQPNPSPLLVRRNTTPHTTPNTTATHTQVNGKVASGPDLSVVVDGLKLPNPFVIGSGPPGTNYAVMKKAFDEGWGAVIAKTVSLDSSKVT